MEMPRKYKVLNKEGEVLLIASCKNCWRFIRESNLVLIHVYHDIAEFTVCSN